MAGYTASSPYGYGTYNPYRGYTRVDPFAPPSPTLVRIYVTSDGYFAGEEVVVYLNGNQVAVGTTDSYGNINMSVTPQGGLYENLGIEYNMAVLGRTSGVTNTTTFSLG